MSAPTTAPPVWEAAAYLDAATGRLIVPTAHKPAPVPPVEVAEVAPSTPAEGGRAWPYVALVVAVNAAWIVPTLAVATMAAWL